MTEFLEAGNKVKITMMFRGREMAYTDRGQEILDKLVLELEEIAEPEDNAKMERKNMFLIMSPRKH